MQLISAGEASVLAGHFVAHSSFVNAPYLVLISILAKVLNPAGLTQRLFQHFASAERLTAAFDAPAAVGQLCRCSGIKELTARKMKQSWNKTRGALCITNSGGLRGLGEVFSVAIASRQSSRGRECA